MDAQWRIGPRPWLIVLYPNPQGDWSGIRTQNSRAGRKLGDRQIISNDEPRGLIRAHRVKGDRPDLAWEAGWQRWSADIPQSDFWFWQNSHRGWGRTGDIDVEWQYPGYRHYTRGIPHGDCIKRLPPCFSCLLTLSNQRGTWLLKLKTKQWYLGWMLEYRNTTWHRNNIQMHDNYISPSCFLVRGNKYSNEWAFQIVY